MSSASVLIATLILGFVGLSLADGVLPWTGARYAHGIPYNVYPYASQISIYKSYPRIPYGYGLPAHIPAHLPVSPYGPGPALIPARIPVPIPAPVPIPGPAFIPARIPVPYPGPALVPARIPVPVAAPIPFPVAGPAPVPWAPPPAVPWAPPAAVPFAIPAVSAPLPAPFPTAHYGLRTFYGR